MQRPRHALGGKSRDDYPPGRRYCSLCAKSFSANNFRTQHMRKLHPDEERRTAHDVRCRTSDEVWQCVVALDVENDTVALL